MISLFLILNSCSENESVSSYIQRYNTKEKISDHIEYVLVSYVLSMLLNVLRRDCLWIRKTRLCRKKWFVDSTLRLKQQREFREPRKLCLNLCLRKCLRQASAYEACNRTRTPLHTPKTLETWRAKKTRLFWLKKLQGVRQIARLKQRYLSFTFYKTQGSYEKIMCIDLLFHWLSGENSIMHFHHWKDDRHRQIKKKHEGRNNRISDVYSYRLKP